MPIPAGPNIPSLETVLNTVRALFNDSFAGATATPGEGQILTDQVPSTTTNNPYVLNCLNSAIRELYRRLRLHGSPTLIQDNYVLTGLPVIDGANGAGSPDPATQTYLNYAEYFDGTSAHTSLKLPADLLMPFRLWERESTTNDTFIPMTRAVDGLDPIDQVDRLVEWEWRNDVIYFHGATIPRDIRIRYQGVFPQFFTASLNFSTTYIPIMDCEDAVAYLTAKRIAVGLAPAALQALTIEAEAQVAQLKNEQVRNMQSQNFRRPAYDDADVSQDLDAYGI